MTVKCTKYDSFMTMKISVKSEWFFFLFIIKLTENMTKAFQENFLFVTLKKVAEMTICPSKTAGKLIKNSTGMKKKPRFRRA